MDTTYFICDIFIPFAICFATVTFLYGFIMFIRKRKEEGEALKKSKRFMGYSLVLIFIMVIIWEVLTIRQNTLDISNIGRDNLPPCCKGI